MGVEIERKFLLLHDGWRSLVTKTVEYRQGYLTRQEKSSVRIRLSQDHAFLNIKSLILDAANQDKAVPSGMVRQEYEYPIPLEDARELLRLCEGALIEKTRYYVPYGDHIWEIDCFWGENEGLIVAEIELSAPEESFSLPSWVGEEVTHDVRYYNVTLVDNPYRHWS